MDGGPSKEDLAPFPERIGRYEVLLPIAAGGMATVYLARTTSVGRFEREVALKLTHSHLRMEPEFTDALMDEAALAGRIRHPNVVSVLDVDEDPHGLFLVMDYVEGESLSGLMRCARADGAPVPPDIAMRIADDALAGLHAAHELRDADGELVGLVHRDVTPQNILVGTDGVARLTDFGVAKAATRLGNTGTGVVKGKISYMSPEQARGQALARTCDVWGAGVVVWELLTGMRLYDTTNDAATLLRIVSDPPPKIRTVNPKVPEELEGVVARALAMNTDERFQTADDFARELAKAADATVGRAERRAVAEHVTQLVADRLAQRRAKVAEVIEIRKRMGKIAASSTHRAVGTPSSTRVPPTSTEGDTPDDLPTIVSPPAGSSPVAAPVALAERTQTDAISVASTRGPPRVSATSPIVWAATGIAAVATVVAASAGLFVLLSGGPDPAGVTSAEPPAAPVGSAPNGDPAPPPADPPSASSAIDVSVLDSTLEVRVEADAEIVSVVVGDREVPFAEPSRTQRLEITPEEQGKAIVAVAEDGRRARARLADGGAVLRLTFDSPPGDPGVRTGGGRGKGPSSTPGRRLLGNPYKGKR